MKNDIPEWAKWLRTEKTIPECCYTCINYIDGRCVVFDAEPPQKYKETPNLCDKCELDEIPF